MSRICCTSRRNTPCTYKILNILTSTDSNDLNQKVKAIAVGSFFPLCLFSACLCDLTINIIRVCKPNFFRAAKENELPLSVIEKFKNGPPKNAS